MKNNINTCYSTPVLFPNNSHYGIRINYNVIATLRKVLRNLPDCDILILGKVEQFCLQELWYKLNVEVILGNSTLSSTQLNNELIIVITTHCRTHTLSHAHTVTHTLSHTHCHTCTHTIIVY